MDLTTYVIIFITVLLLISGIFVVKQQTSAVIERFGKFIAIRKPGLHFKIPIIDRIVGRVSLRILQLDVIVETKTIDDVFVKLKDKEILALNEINECLSKKDYIRIADIIDYEL